MYNYGYNYGYNYYSPSFDGLFVAFLIGVVALAIVMVVSWCRLFHKAGTPWGFYFIPFYGTYLTYSIAGCSGFFWLNLIIGILSGIITSLAGYSVTGVVSVIVAIISIIIQIVYCCNLASSFGKSGGFAVGLIFLFPIFLMILAFGSARYGNYGYTGRTVTSTWTCTCGTVNASSRISCEHCGAQKR